MERYRELHEEKLIRDPKLEAESPEPEEGDEAEEDEEESASAKAEAAREGLQEVQSLLDKANVPWLRTQDDRSLFRELRRSSRRMRHATSRYAISARRPE